MPYILLAILIAYLILTKRKIINQAQYYERYIFSYYYNNILIKNIFVDLKEITNHKTFTESIGTFGIRLVIKKNEYSFNTTFVYFIQNQAKSINFTDILPDIRKEYKRNEITLLVNPV